MRIALISIAGEGEERARLAGRPIAWHQVHAALALGCERIVCLAHAPSADLAAIQRAGEGGGAAFHAVAHHRALAGLVGAADTITVFAPGVLPDRAWLAGTSAARTGVATFPADGAVERGFERIDREHAWAGVLTARGDAVEALSALPPDADPIAALLRVALQRGVPLHPVPNDWLEQGRWAMLASPAEAGRHEGRWFAQQVAPPPWERPLDRAAHYAARAMTARGMAAAPVLGAGGAAVAVGAAAAGYIGYTAGGLLGLALAGLVSSLALARERFGRAGTGMAPSRWPAAVRRAVLDAGLIAVAASPAAFGGKQAVFAAAVLVAAMRLAEEPEAPAPIRPFADRTLACLVLAAFAAGERFTAGAALVGLAVLGLRVFWPRRSG